MKRATLKQHKILITMFVLTFVAGCAQQIIPPTAQPSKVSTNLPTKEPTVTLSPLTVEVFTLTPTITPNKLDVKAFCGVSVEDSNEGGISAVFVHQELPDGNSQYQYDVFRFYEDGLVFAVYLFLEQPILNEWPRLRTWFNRESEWFQTQSKGSLMLGNYRVTKENQIFFTTNHTVNSEIMTIDYCGSFTDTKLVLEHYVHNNGYKSSQIEYSRLEVTDK